MPETPPDHDYFSGRRPELEQLISLSRKRKNATLVTCTGRRRIGKSTLIQEFARRHATKGQFYEFQGLALREDQTNQDQLDHFAHRLAELQDPVVEPFPLTNWTQAFALLSQSVPRTGRTVILLDEISWMAAYDKDFPGKLKEAWDTRFHHHRNLTVVLCGSVSSWIEENIVNHSGYYDRLSLRLNLRELSIAESNDLVWRGQNHVSPQEKLRLLSVTGGVPRYLEEIDPKLPARQNILNLCFQKDSPLFKPGGEETEFDNIFGSVLGRRSQSYREIITQLTDRSKSISTLARNLKKSRSGYFTKALAELTLAGFLTEDPTFLVGTADDGKISHFRLSDNYLRFYLKYISPHQRSIARDTFRLSRLDQILADHAIFGLQFENLVLGNQKTIHQILGIEGQVIRASPYRQSATKRRRGCQIDLLIETEDSLYFCEIKSQKQIRATVINQLKEKMRRIYIPHRMKHLNRFPVIIHSGTLSSTLTDNPFFHRTIDFSEFLTEPQQ